MTNKEHVARERANHHAALASLRGPGCKLDGLTIWRKLRMLEKQANAACVAQCNGKAYGSQPYRDDEKWEEFKNAMLAEVCKVFGRTEIPGLSFGGDPRGYSLRINGGCSAGETRRELPAGIHKNWGGDAVLAAEIE